MCVTWVQGTLPSEREITFALNVHKAYEMSHSQMKM